MRKFIYLLLVLFVISCNEQDSSVQDKFIDVSDFVFDVSKDGDILSFASEEDFELAIEYLVKLEQNNQLEMFCETIGFQSYRSIYKNDSLMMANVEDDDVLATFLNAECKVNIGDYLFQINMSDEQVLVWEGLDCNLKSTSTSNQLIDEYSNTDDIFAKLNGELIEQGSYCSQDRNCNSIEYAS